MAPLFYILEVEQMAKKYTTVTLKFESRTQASNIAFALASGLVGTKESAKNDILIEYDNAHTIDIHLSQKEERHLTVEIK